MIYGEDPFRRRPRELTARCKVRERGVWMATKLAKWASEMIELSNQERRMATRKNSFYQRRWLTTIGSDLKVIWGMSVNKSGFLQVGITYSRCRAKVFLRHVGKAEK